MDWHFRVDISLDLGRVHVRDMLEASWESVVLADQGIEDISKVNVGVLITGIDATVLVVEPNSASNGLCQSKTGGLGLDPAEFVPLFLSNVLSDQTVLGLDGWEFRL